MPEQERLDIDYEYSRPFDWYHACHYEPVWELSRAIASEIDALAERRRRSESNELSFTLTIQQIILDCYSAYISSPSLALGCSRSAKFYSSNRNTPIEFSYRNVRSAMEGLDKLGYLEFLGPKFHHVANSGHLNRQSRMRAKDAFINRIQESGLRHHHYSRHPDEQLIVLKDENKKIIAYDSTDEANRMRDVLHEINGLLFSSNVDICLSDEKMDELRNSLRQSIDSHAPRAINFSRKSLVRVFNNSDWEQGGRFYRGWWQGIPSQYRKYITLNGEPTVEVDYKSLSVSLAYGQVDMDNPYKDGYFFEGVYRKSVKRLFNRALNINENRKPRRMIEYPLPEGETYESVIERLLEKHEPISDQLFNEVGLGLQYYDSQIAELILMQLKDMNIVCLPIHDSFIVTKDNWETLQSLMKSTYTVITGRNSPEIETEEQASDSEMSEWLVDGKLQGYIERHQY